MSLENNKKGIIFGLYIAVFLMFLFNPYKIINYFIYHIFPVITLLGAYSAYRAYGKNNIHSKAFFYLFLGTIAINIAELMTTISKYVYNIRTFPTPSDVFFAIAVILIFIGIIIEYRSMKFKMQKWIKVSLAFLATILIGLVICFVTNPNYNLFQNIVNVGFRIIEVIFLILLIVIFLMSREYKNGKLQNPWMNVSVGMALHVIGGVILGVFHQQFKSGEYIYIILVDMFWAIGYAFIGYGFYQIADLIKEFHNDIKVKIRISRLINEIKNEKKA